MISLIKAYTIVAVSVDGVDYNTRLPEVKATGGQFRNILSIAIATLAAICVLMIVLAGFRFITGQGNPQETAKARNTIIYAIVGLLLAITAQSIVVLTLGKLK